MRKLVMRVSSLPVISILSIAASQRLSVSVASGASADEDKVWQLEHSYWEYVKALDVKAYKSLWHEEFVGWPPTEPAPLRKDHIADWLSSRLAKQNTLQCYRLEPAGFTVVENVAITHYRLTERWIDKTGKSKPRTIKVTHSWLRTPNGWQIIGRMAAEVTTESGCN